MNKVNKRYFLEILKKYREGTASKEEVKFLEAYYNVFELNDDLITRENEDRFLDIKIGTKLIVDGKIKQYEEGRVLMPRRTWINYAAAAAVLIFISGACFFIFHQRTTNQLTARSAKSVLPGKNRALLTLADGTQVALDDTQKGEIARQGKSSVTKAAGDQIIYREGNAGDKQKEQTGNSGERIGDNTITTLKSSEYQLVLPDGTKVLLNASTTLKYPVSFHGPAREVELTGEAYFEVAKNQKMPFRVKSGAQTVEVLGTHFDINSYSDEPDMKTTLLEGSVKILFEDKATILVPGEQGVVNPQKNEPIVKHPADIEKEMAWKNGFFAFETNDLKSVMRAVARWYDIEISYKGDIPPQKFTGEISRDGNLSQVAEILALSHIRMDISGKTVSISYDPSMQPAGRK